MVDQTIPIVDISYAVSLSTEDTLVTKHGSDVNIKELAKEMLNSFTKFGFVYIKGHGISNETVSNIFQISLDYFNLPIEEKNKNIYENDKLNFCYVLSRCEQFSGSSSYDMKEAFDFVPTVDAAIQSKLPCVFNKSFDSFFWDCTKLTFLLLELLNIAYDICPPQYFLHSHQGIGSIKKNISTLRTLYYPAVNRNVNVDRVRCSEHTDYGTMTLLFQDEIGGLEVESKDGEFIPIVPIKDTIVVNASDLLERWTSGVIKSAKHRVILPTSKNKLRQSIAFFCQPDNDITVSCLDGTKQYNPVNALEYLRRKFKQSYY